MPNRIILLLFTILLLSGCSATVKPPENLVDPVTIYLVDHGRHASLVLPTEDRFTRFSYGDWDYYALRKTGFNNAIPALFWSTTGALGRQTIPAADGHPDWQAANLIIEAIYPIEVEKQASQDLSIKLADTFQQFGEHHYINYQTGMQFVPIDQKYRIDRNSNQRIGQWLEVLGCEVEGILILSNWRIE